LSLTMTAFTSIPLSIHNFPYIRHCRHFRHKKRAECRQLRFCLILCSFRSKFVLNIQTLNTPLLYVFLLSSCYLSVSYVTPKGSWIAIVHWICCSIKQLRTSYINIPKIIAEHGRAHRRTDAQTHTHTHTHTHFKITLMVHRIILYPLRQGCKSGQKII
jgi:hypothetical protein